MLPPEIALWFAAQVVPQHEFKVAAQLRCKGQQEFLPTYVSRRQWSDRVKITQKPLFPGYVFCRVRRSSIATILNTSGVYRIICFGGRPCPIPDEEICFLQTALASGRDVDPVPYLFVGKKVKVISGPLSGVTGIVAKFRNGDRLVISIGPIMKSISLEISASELLALDAAS